MKKVYLLVNLSLILALQASAQEQEITFKRFFNESGLSHNTVWALTQDQQGYMWFGTFDGLNKYDGYTFKIYKNNPADSTTLVNNFILTTLTDSRGNLWVGTSEGVDLYDPTHDNFIHFKPDINSGHANYYVNFIYEDKARNIWIGGQNGLNKFDPKKKKFVDYEPVNVGTSRTNKHVETFGEDSEGNLWVGYKDALFIYNPQKKELSPVNFPGSDNKNLKNKGSDLISTIYRDPSGRMWIGTCCGLFYYNTPTKSFVSFPKSLGNKDILSITRDRKGTFWIGSTTGLYTFNEQSEAVTAYHTSDDKNTLSDNLTKTVFEDRNGNIWVGTFNGLNFINADKKQFKNFEIAPNLTSQNYIHDFEQDKEGNIWITTAGGLYVFDETNDQLIKKSIKNNSDFAWFEKMLVDKQNNFWIEKEGLLLYNKQTGELTEAGSFYSEKLPNNITSMYKDSHGKFWLGTLGSGLYTISPDSVVTHYLHDPDQAGSLANNHINKIYEDCEGNIWIGTPGGLELYNPERNNFIHHKSNPADKNSVSHNSINAIIEDSRGSLWIGTGNGLNKFNRKTKVFTSFDQKDGLPSDVINAILEDNKGNLWISTNKGIVKFDLLKKKWYTYDVSDGLQGNQFNPDVAFKTKEGKLFFGGINGFNVFHPDSIGYNKVVPNVLISNFQIFNKPVPIGEKSVLQKHISYTKDISLSYKHAVFSFEFVALNYSSSDKNQYAYKLEGFDEDWVSSGSRRFATYTNLPAGKTYTFRVKASNNDGVWNEKGTFVNIYIKPPFWETIWFRSFLAFAIVGSAYSGYWFRITNIKKQKYELEKLVTERTAEVVMQKEELQAQAEQIESMNKLLQQDNKKLEEDVKGLSKARVMQKRVSFEEFQLIYPDDDSCFKYIEELKWGNGFVCKKCSNSKCSPGNAPYSRRCSRCNYIETITAGTIFSRLKFPISKAFYILFLVSAGKHLTVDEMSDILALRRNTCWNFKKKVVGVIQSKAGLKKNKDGWSHLILTPEVEE